jgi:hypothetical protein
VPFSRVGRERADRIGEHFWRKIQIKQHLWSMMRAFSRLTGGDFKSPLSDLVKRTIQNQ